MNAAERHVLKWRAGPRLASDEHCIPIKRLAVRSDWWVVGIVPIVPSDEVRNLHGILEYLDAGKVTLVETVGGQCFCTNRSECRSVEVRIKHVEMIDCFKSAAVKCYPMKCKIRRKITPKCRIKKIPVLIGHACCAIDYHPPCFVLWVPRGVFLIFFEVEIGRRIDLGRLIDRIERRNSEFDITADVAIPAMCLNEISDQASRLLAKFVVWCFSNRLEDRNTGVYSRQPRIVLNELSAFLQQLSEVVFLRRRDLSSEAVQLVLLVFGLLCRDQSSPNDGTEGDRRNKIHREPRKNVDPFGVEFNVNPSPAPYENAQHRSANKCESDGVCKPYAEVVFILIGWLQLLIRAAVVPRHLLSPNAPPVMSISSRVASLRGGQAL